MLFRQIFDPKLAQYAYLVGCQQTGEAILFDPERDIDRYVDLAEEEALRIVAVAETHIHADFLSGARELAERFRVRVYLSDEGGEAWKYEWINEDRKAGGRYDYVLLRDGDEFTVGNIRFTVLHTPGHTPEHLAYLVTDKGGGADEPMGLLSGDFVFVGDLGRPDLLEQAAGLHGVQEPSARELFRSLPRFTELGDYIQVWPAHGAGSTCGKSLGAVPQSTVGYEKRFNASLDAARSGEEAFVGAILGGQPEPQMYFARMKRDNKLGAPVLGNLPSPRELSSSELIEVVKRGDSLIVDTRLDRPSFFARHVTGSLYAPFNKAFNTVIGSLVVDEGTPLILIIEAGDVEAAVRDLVRIGYDNVVAFADERTLMRYFANGGPASTIEEIRFPEIGEVADREDVAVIDVRFRSEYDGGSVPGSVSASYTRLPEYLDRIPSDKTLLVYCSTGARAAAASAYLASLGHSVVLINDNFENCRLEALAV
ncbi:MAG TPA: rhodanese-like domain-containing protein [Rhodothermales bacterium]|nr:rhodanese-like domain-containing protein [Rhodothermales bacterium]